MDLSSIKESLSAEAYEALEKHINDLTTQRDIAKAEIVKSKKEAKGKIAELEKNKNAIFEKLGISSDEELTVLDAKNQTEAVKQFESKLKRLDKELSDKSKAYDELFNKYRNSLKNTAVRKAIGQHEFIDSDLIESYLEHKLEWDDDELFYKTSNGALLPLADGIKLITQEKPHLLKGKQSSGSGYHKQEAAETVKNPWLKGQENFTEQLLITRENPQLASQLKQQASIH